MNQSWLININKWFWWGGCTCFFWSKQMGLSGSRTRGVAPKLKNSILFRRAIESSMPMTSQQKAHDPFEFHDLETSVRLYKRRPIVMQNWSWHKTFKAKSEKQKDLLSYRALLNQTHRHLGPSHSFVSPFQWWPATEKMVELVCDNSYEKSNKRSVHKTLIS